MSIYKGTELLAGVATNTISNAHSLFDFMWSDHIKNEMSWLRADTFSWQSGAVYIAAYNHLTADINGKTTISEMVGSYTISYYLADDGHKITTDETTVANIYNESGVAWYYVLDTTNQRFKLPRTKFGFTGLRDVVGKYVEAGLPNIAGSIRIGSTFQTRNGDGALYSPSSGSVYTSGGTVQDTDYGIGFDASRYNSIYGNSSTVQPPATQMYLYFYVGEYTQSQAEQVATLDVEMFNNKVDTNMLNLTNVGKNISNWSTNITNCITETPNNVKLELNNGIVTLKAGSKVIFPAGGNTFNKYTTTADISIDFSNNNSGTLMLFLPPSANFLDNIIVQNCVSGSTDSLSGTTYHTWYDTTNNVINIYTTNASVADRQISFPIAIVTLTRVNTTTTVKIDQVFNGFGYIGSTIFVLPGVKGLIPNGRNEDGTLNNTIFTVSNVLTRTQTASGWHGMWSLYIKATAAGAHPTELEYISDSKPTNIYTPTAYWYSPADNKLYYTQDTGTSWTQSLLLHCVDYTESSTKITSLKNKEPFRSVDYNDAVKYTDFATDAATTTSSASLRKPAVIVENYKNGTSWYRIWSDGWCEQGGLIEKPASNYTATIYLLKPYKDTSWEYLDSMQLYSATGFAWDVEHEASVITAKTENSFSRACGNGASYSWQAKGYIS